MGFLRNSFAFAALIVRRSTNHIGLLIAVWAGFSLAIGMIASIPVYAEATGYRILVASLAEKKEQDSVPPFSVVYTYGGATTKPVLWSQYLQADALASSLAERTRLPAEHLVRYAGTDQMQLLPPDAQPGTQNAELLFGRLAFVSGIQDQIQIIAGNWPTAWRRDGPIEVLVSERVSNDKTLLVGDTYVLRTTASSGVALALPVRVAGIWHATDPSTSYWFNSPAVYSQMLIIPQESFAAVVDNPSTPLVASSAWYTALEGSTVRSSDVTRLTDEITAITADVQRLLPGTELKRSPIDALLRHRDQVRLLTVNLALFSVPLLGLLIYFVAQVAGMVVQRQQQEIAVLRSRGSTRLQVLGLALGEGLILCAVALAAGLGLGLVIAQLMLWTQSFLTFVPQPSPPLELPAASIRYGLLMAALVLPALMAPALAASSRTIISFKQDRARTRHAPLLRLVLTDILLLIPALYGLQQLRNQGMISVPGMASSASDPFSNPLLLLAPSLFVFGCALLTIHLFPSLLAFLAWAFNRLPGVAVLLAMRFLSRSALIYRAPVLLIIITLSLAAFTASMARTLDAHSMARARYAGGPDVRLAYENAGTTGDGGSEQTAGAGAIQGNIDYLFIPPDDYLTIPGVNAVTRAAPSRTSITAGSATEDGTFLAIDRQTMAGAITKSWRADYADESLGSLMNLLADSPDAALISTGLASQRGLRPGDVIQLELNDRGEAKKISFRVAGIVRNFPTLYDEQLPFVIGNLDYSADEQGGLYPYEIWLSTTADASIPAIKSYALGNRLKMRPDSPAELLTADLLRPERQGLFGLLSVGFLAAAMVTILGFLIFSLVSFQRRLVELGMLRALGMGSGQLTVLLVVEQALVIGLGTLVGTGLGVLTSRMFVPFMQVRTGNFPGTPPFVVQIAWEQISAIYGIAGGLLLATVLVTLLLLRRMRIFEAVKLGEAV